MYSQLCACGCADEPEKNPNGTYKAFAEGHGDENIAKKYRDLKKAAFEQMYKDRAKQNAQQNAQQNTAVTKPQINVSAQPATKQKPYVVVKVKVIG